MKFQIYQDGTDRQYYFQLLDNNDNILLTSGSYADQDSCTGSIRDALDLIDDRESFESIVENGQYFAVLRGTDGREIARSAAFPFGQGATDLITQINTTANVTEDYPVTVTRTSTDETSESFPFMRGDDIPIEELYDFTQVSTSGKSGFEPFQSKKNELYYFHFNDEQGNAILYSRSFSTTSRRNSRIRSVINNAGIPARYEQLEADGKYFFILKARNGQEIARSRMFDSPGQLETASVYLQNRAKVYAEEYAKKKRSRTASNQYDLTQKSASGAAGFEAFKSDKDKQNYFHFNDDDGEAILYSQSYGSPKSRDNGLRSVIRNASNPARYEQKEENGRYYFVLKAGNRQEIARSGLYASAQDVARTIAYLQSVIPGYAAAYGVTLQITTTEEESFTLSIDRDQSETLDDVGVAAGIAGAAVAGSLDDTGDVTESDTEDVLPEPEPEPVVSSGDSTMYEEVEATEIIDPDPTPEPEPEPEPVAAPQPEPVAAASSRVQEADTGGGGCLRWILLALAIALLLALLFWALRGCGSEQPTAGPIDTPSTSQPSMIGDGDTEGTTDGDNAGDAGTTDTGDNTGDAGTADGGDTGDGGTTDGTTDGAAADGGDAAGSGVAGTTGDTGDTTPTADPEPEPKPKKVRNNNINTFKGDADKRWAPGSAGPDGDDLGLKRGSMEWNLANYLSNSSHGTPAKFTMDDIRFPFNSAKMNMGAYPQVNRLIEVLRAYPNVHLDIYGHIDGTESNSYSGRYQDEEQLDLDAVRARCLYKKLAQQDIAENRLSYKGFAATQPVASDDTQRGRQQNRRVEIVVTRR